MSELPSRFLTFERCFNFRDLGGYAGRDGRRVRWRRLFRSMTPQYMNEADAAGAAELGISLVIDFRGEQYPTSGPVLAESGSRLTLSPPLRARDDPDYESYRRMPPTEALPRLLESYGTQFALAIQTLATHPDEAALFHCRLGKDRTGVFAALLLKLLGVSDADIVRDYMLTAEQEPLCRELLEKEEDAEDVSRREPAVAKEPPNRAAIEAVLRRLAAEYGGALSYFVGLGVPAEQIELLIDNVLEPLGDRHGNSNGSCACDDVANRAGDWPD